MKVRQEVIRDRKLRIVLMGAVMILVGLFLPWYTTISGGVEVSAGQGITNGKGAVLAVFAVLAVLTSVSTHPGKLKNAEILAVIAAVLSFIIVISSWPNRLYGEVNTVEAGYWLALAGTLVLFLGSVLGIQMSTTQPSKRKNAKKP